MYICFLFDPVSMNSRDFWDLLMCMYEFIKKLLCLLAFLQPRMASSGAGSATDAGNGAGAGASYVASGAVTNLGCSWTFCFCFQYVMYVYTIMVINTI